MCTLFLDAVFREHQDPLGVLDRGQTVRDDQSRSVFGKFFQRLLDDALTLVVERRGRFIKNKDRRVLQENTGDGEPLLLSAAEFDASLTDIRIVAVRKFHDEIMGVGTLGGIDHIFESCIRPTIADIFQNCSCEKVNILLHDADLFSQRSLGDRGDIGPVDQDPAGLRFVESRDQAADRGLADTGMTDQRDIFARIDVKIQMREYIGGFGRLAVIREGYILKIDISLYAGHFSCIRSVLDIRLDADHLVETFESGHAVLELLGKADELSDRLGEVIHIKKKCDQILKCQRILSDHEGSDRGDDDRDQSGRSPEDGVIDRHIPVVILLASEEHVVALCELMDLHILAGKGLDDPDAREAVLHAGVDLGDLFAVLFERPFHFLIQNRSEDDHERNRNQCDQRQRDIDHAQDDQGADQLDGGDHKVFRPVVIQLRDLEKVIGHARHQGTDLLVVVEPEGQLLIMREKLISQVIFHPGADHMADVGDEVITAEFDAEKPQHDQEQV